MIMFNYVCRHSVVKLPVCQSWSAQLSQRLVEAQAVLSTKRRLTWFEWCRILPTTTSEIISVVNALRVPAAV